VTKDRKFVSLSNDRSSCLERPTFQSRNVPPKLGLIKSAKHFPNSLKKFPSGEKDRINKNKDLVEFIFYFVINQLVNQAAYGVANQSARKFRARNNQNSLTCLNWVIHRSPSK
jgi:hypothetical protein